MSIYKREAFILVIGDILLFALALWAALAIRFGEIPSRRVLDLNFPAFIPLFFLWAAIFFIAGLYGKHTLVFKSKLFSLLLKAQIIGSVLAVFFFYFIRYFAITPKRILFLYLAISFGLVFCWRVYGVPLLGFRKKQKAILVASGEEAQELWDEVNGNPRYAFHFVARMDPSSDAHRIAEDVGRRAAEEGVAIVVADMKNRAFEPAASQFYQLIFSGVRFLDVHTLYEDIFDRVPLSLLRDRWFVENIPPSAHSAYDLLKRIMDITVALIIGIPSLVFYPFVWCAIKGEDGGPVFIVQERIGRGGKIVRIPKFRTMNVNDGGEWLSPGDRRLTQVGYFLRKLRIDEFPQLWSVIRGDLSLIGPRPDIRDLGKTLEAQIPHYAIRNIIQPGLSGWAQIKQDLPPQSVEATKVRLSYDLYYIKNRSFALDLEIAAKTIRTLLSRSGM
ncbi:MAG: sugar transferase [Candidatus Niyogibacteria bacterium]|nr:sugar transferase [Candidatus Niyogibacteria bacterium]